jgi:hypothetical protein
VRSLGSPSECLLFLGMKFVKNPMRCISEMMCYVSIDTGVLGGMLFLFLYPCKNNKNNPVFLIKKKKRKNNHIFYISYILLYCRFPYRDI